MRLALTVLAVIVGVAIGHAMFAFYWLSFNPAEWSASGRYFALNFYLLFAAFFGAAAWSGVKRP